MQLSIKDQ